MLSAQKYYIFQSGQHMKPAKPISQENGTTFAVHLEMFS